jgi:hypothetical protein
MSSEVRQLRSAAEGRASDDPLIGRTLSHYRIVAKLGSNTWYARRALEKP